MSLGGEEEAEPKGFFSVLPSDWKTSYEGNYFLHI